MYTISRIWDDWCDWEDCPASQYDSIEAARVAAVQHINAHANEGDYGQYEGVASVTICYSIADEDGDEIDSYEYETHLVVEEPESDCDHEWTSEGEGGCDDNPGVWSTGGTTFEFHYHCRICGLRKIKIDHGPQRNPGESDSVLYEQADEELIARWRESGAMNDEQRRKT